MTDEEERKTFTRRYGKKIASTFSIFMVSVSLTLVVWQNEQPPSAFYERTVLTPEVEPGQIFKVKIKVYWTKTCYSKLYRNIIDGAGKLTPYEREVRENKEGRREFVVESLIPYDATPGDATWEVTTDWYCNPWQNYFPKRVILEPLQFKIIPMGRVPK